VAVVVVSGDYQEDFKMDGSDPAKIAIAARVNQGGKNMSQSGKGGVIKMVPALVVPWLLYHIFAVAGDNVLEAQMFAMTLASGQEWGFTMGHFLIVLGLGLLYWEIFKSTRTGTDSPIVDHMASLLLFIVALLEFVMVKITGTSTFFILTMMMLVDVVGGFTISFTGARRDFGGV
jgi:hypothetical protein